MFSILSIIISCSTKKFVLFIIFVLKFYLFVCLFICLFVCFNISVHYWFDCSVNQHFVFIRKAIFLRCTGTVYLTLPTLNKWINKTKIPFWQSSSNCSFEHGLFPYCFIVSTYHYLVPFSYRFKVVAKCTKCFFWYFD